MNRCSINYTDKHVREMCVCVVGGGGSPVPQCAQVVFELWADVGQQVGHTVAYWSRLSRTRVKHFEGRPETQNKLGLRIIYSLFNAMQARFEKKKKNLSFCEFNMPQTVCYSKNWVNLKTTP